MEDKAPRRYAFGGFVLDAREKTLTKGSRQVSITPKALEILIILVEDAGHLVSKEDLFQKVWAESFVEDANLTHHISRLRRALEESDENKFIETLPKRGYRFVAEIRQVSDPGFPIADRKTERQLENNEANRSATEKPFLRPWFASAKTFPVLLGLVLIILVSAVVVWFNVRDPGERSLHDPRLTLPNQSAIVRITNSGKVGAATISPDGKFVAYIQNYTLGEGMLYVRQVETNTEAKLLAPEERVFGSISFSPDSAFVYYITYDKRDPGGALYRIPVLGGQPTRVLANVKFMFSLSPDGKRAAFYRFDAQQKQTSIVHAALDGNNDEKTVLTFNDAEKTITSVPAFSPDGRFISFGLADAATGMYYDAPQFSLFAADLQSGEIKSLTGEKWSEIGKTNWMPDGSGLVFVASRPRIGSQIYFLSYPGGDLHRLTNELNTYGNYGMGVTHDGTTLVADLYECSSQLWGVDAVGASNRSEQLTTGDNDGSGALATLSDGSIVYSTRAGDDFDLWLMSEKNRKREGRPLTADAFNESEVCATSDDRFLVFASDRAGSRHIFRINTDGSDIKQLTFGDSFDDAPDCAPDGNSIVYASQANGRTLLRKISIEGGEPLALTDFEANVPTFSPDGKMIACIQPSESVVKPATLAVISSDGGAPLKMFPVVQFAWSYRPPRWTPRGDALIFSKIENSVGNLWRQNFSDGTLTRVTDFKSDTIFNYVFSRDGKRLIIARGKYVGDVVAIKNFTKSF